MLQSHSRKFKKQEPISKNSRKSEQRVPYQQRQPKERIYKQLSSKTTSKKKLIAVPRKILISKVQLVK